MAPDPPASTTPTTEGRSPSATPSLISIRPWAPGRRPSFVLPFTRDSKLCGAPHDRILAGGPSPPWGSTILTATTVFPS